VTPQQVGGPAIIIILPLDVVDTCVCVLAWLGVEVKTIPTTNALAIATTLATISLIPSKGGSDRAGSRLNSNV
jgi:hypothetical protein